LLLTRLPEVEPSPVEADIRGALPAFPVGLEQSGICAAWIDLEYITEGKRWYLRMLGKEVLCGF
jgi:hypothetical protein